MTELRGQPSEEMEKRLAVYHVAPSAGSTYESDDELHHAAEKKRKRKNRHHAYIELNG